MIGNYGSSWISRCDFDEQGHYVSCPRGRGSRRTAFIGSRAARLPGVPRGPKSTTPGEVVGDQAGRARSEFHQRARHAAGRSRPGRKTARARANVRGRDRCVLAVLERPNGAGRLSADTCIAGGLHRCRGAATVVRDGLARDRVRARAPLYRAIPETPDVAARASAMSPSSDTLEELFVLRLTRSTRLLQHDLGDGMRYARRATPRHVAPCRATTRSRRRGNSLNARSGASSASLARDGWAARIARLPTQDPMSRSVIRVPRRFHIPRRHRAPEPTCSVPCWRPRYNNPHADIPSDYGDAHRRVSGSRQRRPVDAATTASLITGRDPRVVAAICRLVKRSSLVRLCRCSPDIHGKIQRS